MGAEFLGNDPFDTADRLIALADDLRQLAGGHTPDLEVIASCPRLHRWRFHGRLRPALTGFAEGHPLIGDGRHTITSEVYAVDPARRWARTLSRFYVLGDVSPIAPGSSRHDGR